MNFRFLSFLCHLFFVPHSLPKCHSSNTLLDNCLRKIILTLNGKLSTLFDKLIEIILLYVKATSVYYSSEKIHIIGLGNGIVSQQETNKFLPVQCFYFTFYGCNFLLNGFDVFFHHSDQIGIGQLLRPTG